MKKAILFFTILASAICLTSCNNTAKENNVTTTDTSTSIDTTATAARDKNLEQSGQNMIKEIVKGEQDKPITIETKRGKMHGQIEMPGTITLTDPQSAKNIISRLTPAQGYNTYNCAVIFTGTTKKGKIWNFTPNTITINVEWKYENGSTSTDQVVVESQKFGFTHANTSKSNTKTITYTVN